MLDAKGWGLMLAVDGNSDNLRGKTFSDHLLATLVRIYQLRSATRAAGITMPSTNKVVVAKKPKAHELRAEAEQSSIGSVGASAKSLSSSSPPQPHWRICWVSR